LLQGRRGPKHLAFSAVTSGDESLLTYASVDDPFNHLHHTGWYAGQAGDATGWLVTGTNEANCILIEGSTQAEAWLRTAFQAEIVAMLAPIQGRLRQGR
jgi:hypothetical protein